MSGLAGLLRKSGGSRFLRSAVTGGDAREAGGATLGSRDVNACELEFGRKPQEGRHPRVALVGNADGPAIETLKRPSVTKQRSRPKGKERNAGRSAGEESARTRARRGSGESLEEGARARRPCPSRKTWYEPARSRWNPRSAVGTNGSPHGGSETAGRIEGEANRRGRVKRRGRTVGRGWKPGRKWISTIDAAMGNGNSKEGARRIRTVGRFETVVL